MSRHPAGSALESVATPKQRRSEETLQRILAEAEALLCARGLAGCSVREIVRRAGSSVGSFYARFRDKDELLRALHERNLQQLFAELAPLFDPATHAGVPVRDVARVFLRELVQRTQDKRLLHQAFLESIARSPEAWQQAFAQRQLLVERVSALFLARKAELNHPDPEAAVPFAIQMILGAVDQRVLFAGPGTQTLFAELPDDTLVGELERMMAGYLAV